MVIEEERVKRWNCIYPIYFDSTKSHSEGRRVPKSLAIPNPNCNHIKAACASLNLPYFLESEKRHPRDPFLFGRVRVQLFDEAHRPIYSEIPNVRTLIAKIAKELPEISKKISTTQPQTRQDNTVQSPTAMSADGLTFTIRKKKSKK